MELLISDITKLIFDQLDFLSQISIRLVSKKFTSYPVTNLFDNVPMNKLSDEILRLYPHATKLNAGKNSKITNVNHLINLRRLDAWGFESSIDNNGLSNLTNLIDLHIDYNEKIININSLQNLRSLNVS